MFNLFYKEKSRYSIAIMHILTGVLMAALLLPGSDANAQFIAGNITVFVATSASANNTTGSIVELNTSFAGQTGTTYTIPGTTGANILRFSGSARI